MKTVHKDFNAQTVTYAIMILGGLLMTASLVVSTSSGTLVSSWYTNVSMAGLVLWGLRNRQRKAVVYDRLSVAVAVLILSSSALSLMSALAR